MSTQQVYKIEPYSDEMAEAIAVMWNESDDQWPGTFTRGVPMTAERVIKWMQESEYMMNLVVRRDDGGTLHYTTHGAEHLLVKILYKQSKFYS